MLFQAIKKLLEVMKSRVTAVDGMIYTGRNKANKKITQHRLQNWRNQAETVATYFLMAGIRLCEPASCIAT